jgi:TRAP-type mannitol/chloroaromatic compound transport system substrate-binding protein
MILVNKTYKDMEMVMKTATKDPPSKTITEKKAEVQPVTEQLSDKSSASMVSDSILTKVKNEAQKMMKEGCSKAEAAREVYDKLKGKTRKELLTGSCVQCVELSLPCGPVTVA